MKKFLYVWTALFLTVSIVWAAGKISDLTALATAPAVGDLMEIIDVSDTSMAATGTNKQITVANLMGAETNSLETTVTGIADTEIFVGSGANAGAYVVVSGDATLANTGALTIGNEKIDSDHYVDGSIDNAHLAVNSVDSDNYIDASIDAEHISDWYAYEVIPIAWAADGTSAPDPLDDRLTRPPYQYRTFDHAATEDVNLVWFVPSDLSGTTTTIQFRVKYLVVTTAPSDVGVAFTLAGVSMGNNDPTNDTKGTPVAVTQTAITATLWDILITDWSGNVTISNLAAGEVAELNFTRDHDHASDTYVQLVGVLAIELRYVQDVAK